MKNITERFINESRDITYRVSFLDTKDADDIFAHADGENIEY